MEQTWDMFAQFDSSAKRSSSEIPNFLYIQGFPPGFSQFLSSFLFILTLLTCDRSRMIFMAVRDLHCTAGRRELFSILRGPDRRNFWLHSLGKTFSLRSWLCVGAWRREMRRSGRRWEKDWFPWCNYLDLISKWPRRSWFDEISLRWCSKGMKWQLERREKLQAKKVEIIFSYRTICYQNQQACISETLHWQFDTRRRRNGSRDNDTSWLRWKSRFVIRKLCLDVIRRCSSLHQSNHDCPLPEPELKIRSRRAERWPKQYQASACTQDASNEESWY
jgi:hypothetical protein